PNYNNYGYGNNGGVSYDSPVAVKKKPIALIVVLIVVLCIILLSVILGISRHGKNKSVQERQANVEIDNDDSEKSDLVVTSETDDTTVKSTTASTKSAAATTNATTVKSKETQTMKAVNNLDTPEKVTEESSRDTSYEEDYSNLSNGTSSANLFNGGFVATDGTYKYYRGDDGYLYSNVVGENSSVCILQKKIWYINVQGPWIYFFNETDECLSRVRTDGSDYQVLYDRAVHEVNVSGSWVYFGTSDALYRMDSSGNNLQKLVSGNVWFLNVMDDQLCFGLIGDTRQLCRCNLDGSAFNVLIASEVYDILAYCNIIYYCYGSDTRYLYAMDINTNETYQLNANYTRWINTDGSYVYYTNFDEYTDEGVGYGDALYRISMDGSVNEKIYDDDIEGMCVQNGLLYYMNHDKKSSILSLN
ncbi:DUF5050 domain-containing protein, partial [Ruminococcus sp.]|uniref:DUF5050 domain-containing protein n=1 Tax=Ruminococcus sp. TaxID=41978 RepID=UPI0026003E2D